MDKIISLLLANTFALSPVLTEQANIPPVHTNVSVNITIAENCVYTNAENAVFTLSDGQNSYEKTVPVASDRDFLDMSFYISDGYIPGKEFTFTAVSGIDSLLYNGQTYSLGEPITIKTSFLENADGSFEISDSAQMKYIPQTSNEIFLYHNGNYVNLPLTGYVMDGQVLLPLEKLAEILEAELFFDTGYNCYILRNMYVSCSLYENGGIVIENEIKNAPAPTSMNGVLYTPINDIITAFEGTLNFTQHDKGFDVFLNYKPQTPEEKYINHSGHASETDYLIWVSKANFKVHVFTGKAGDWELVRTIPCSIGKSYTPTCEGTYRYYESITKWDYGSYYVAPVMRFNRGYALHSTLVNNDGSDHDGRIGEMVSHGCVRIYPPDMQWLFATVPLYTTVHVTPY